MRAKVLLVLMLLVAFPCRAATESRPAIVAVFDVSVQGLTLQKGVVKLLGDYLAGRLATCGTYSVVPRDQVKQRLVVQKTASYKECYDQSCQIELGKELAADKSLSTTVMKLGSVCEVSSSLYDLRTEASERAAAAEGPCSEDGIRKSMLAVIGQLCGRDVSTAAANPDVGVKPALVVAAPEVESTKPTVKRGTATEATGDLTVSARATGGAGVRLELTPPGGKTVASSSPFKDTHAKVGRWKVVARATGHDAQETSFDVPPDEPTLIKLELRAFGGLRVTGEPAGAAVDVDGQGFRDAGGLPWEAEGLKAGTYKVQVSRTGYETFSSDVVVEPGRTAEVKVKLNKGVAAIFGGDTGLVPLNVISIYVPQPPMPEEKLEASIAALYSLIDMTDDEDPAKPAYYARLAAAYWDKSGSVSDTAERDRWRQKSLNLYLRVVDKFPQYQAIDETLYYLGFALVQMGQQAESYKYFARIIREAPNSQFVPDALLSIGEFYFDTGRIADAEKIYTEVEYFEKSAAYGLAAYKKAWCYYKLGQMESAMQQISSVIRYASSPDAKVIGYAGRLLTESQRLLEVIKTKPQTGRKRK